MKSMSKILTLILALCLLLSVGAFASAEPASGEPSGEPSGEASAEGGIAGTYTDGVNTLVINDNLTFIMEKTGENMDGAAFSLTVTGTVTEDGVFTLTGLFDGELNVFDMATDDQKAGDLASVEAVFAMGKVDASGEPSGEGVAPGTYTDGVNTLVIADDLTFKMEKTGQNMEGDEFVLTVTGTVDAAGNFAIDGLFDGDINLIEVATEDQVAADLASVVAAYNG
ncbi:MAG: hypothetical protein ACI3W7_00290 [Oscillospiraceae bacterium]